MEPYQLLEQELKKWISWGEPVVCSSGTAALHLALEALHLPPGSLVAVPEFTMVACARAVVLAGLKPVFVDCGDDLLMRPELLERLPRDTRAVMAVHIYGRQCNMEAIHQVAAKRGLYIIEDMAEIHGIAPHPETDAACWSFYKNKIVHGEEGGAIAFQTQALADKARKLRNLGFTDAHDFTHCPRGHNYRLANLLAKPILESLSHFQDNLVQRNRVVDYYNQWVPEKWQMPTRQAPWVYDLRISKLTADQQDRIVQRLNSIGIQARHGFKPMSYLREFRSRYHHLNAWRLSQEVMYLPISPGLPEQQVILNASTLIDAYRTSLGPSPIT